MESLYCSKFYMVLVCAAFLLTKEASAAQHTVGGSQGWDQSTDFGSWASGQTFKVGDQLGMPLSLSLITRIWQWWTYYLYLWHYLNLHCNEWLKVKDIKHIFHEFIWFWFVLGQTCSIQVFRDAQCSWTSKRKRIQELWHR